MAHHIKVETVPGRNKDGSISKTKKSYLIYDRTRRGRVFMGKCNTKKELNEQLKNLREDFIEDHLTKHPNDLSFKRKHGLA